MTWPRPRGSPGCRCRPPPPGSGRWSSRSAPGSWSATGAGGGPDSDLARATQLATAAVAALGLDDEAGLLWTGLPDAAALPQLLGSDPGLARRVREMLGEAYATARDIVGRRRTAVEALADALIARRALDGSEAALIVAGHATVTGSATGAAIAKATVP